MILRIDPRFAVVWRSPDSLQFGVASPRVVIDPVSEATERMLAALAVGVGRPGLGMIGRATGATDEQVDALVAHLAPVLGDASHGAEPATVVIVGESKTAQALAHLLASTGIRVRIARDAAAAGSEPCDFAVAVGHFVLDPALAGLWLRRDTAHLPVIVSDTAVVVGPVVAPGFGPCLYCLQLHARDADAAWPAIASQLYGRRSTAETPVVVSETAALACRTVLAWLARESVSTASAHRSIEVDTATGERTSRLWAEHPECGCRAVPEPELELSAAVRSGSGSAGAARAAALHRSPTPSQPTTATAGDGPG